MKSQVQKKKILPQNVKGEETAQNNSEKMARKIVPLSGYLLAQKIKCGRPNCKCARGDLHGPYFYYVWRLGRYRHKEYVKSHDLAFVRAGIEQHRRRKAEIRAFNEQAKADWRNLKERINQILASIKLNLE